ncbi:Cathepsin_B [Hexamita inflata]|uniref:Cathepsin B n=1 Tax=Hexamita inflata TaxID=28002 RepID=A0AA86NVG5_9EUKA|nr:Cathepsin B [Hexamita inflata]
MFCLLISQQSASLQDRLEVLKNIPDLTWTPEIPKFLMNKSQAQVDKHFTPKPLNRKESKMVQFNEKEHLFQVVSVEFDWSVQVPECADHVEPMDECTAIEIFASVNMLSDIRCIHGKDEQRVQYSPQLIINCFSQGKGCDMNELDYGMEHLEAPYGTVPSSCVSYTSGSTGKLSKCQTKCDDGSSLPKRTTINAFSGVSAQNWSYEFENMAQRATMSGPIQFSFTAYDDLQFYSSGVYTHQFGNVIGEFRGEVMGWGTDGNVKFWKLKMPFGAEWGEGGYIRIAQEDLNSKYWSFDVEM